MEFFKELKRRNVIRETLAYVVVSWVILQVGAIVFPTFDAPEWVMKTLTFLLILGLPLWIFFSWAYQITPEGFKKTRNIEEDPVYSSRSVKRLDILIVVMLIGAIVITAMDRPLLNYFSGDPEILEITANSRPDNSIAVLPFVNMSNEDNQDYFAEGLSIELINRFAQVPELTVKGQTSSFSYKGTDKDLQEIGDELNVKYILEGSVRKSGDLIRITVQLIDSENGLNLWNDQYDRELDDIFKIQNEISNHVIGALKITVLDVVSKSVNGNVDPKAYDHFLKGRFYYETFAIENSTLRALDEFNKAIELDSSFALAWTYKGRCHYRFSKNEASEFARSKEASIKAFDLNPRSGIVLINMGDIYLEEFKLNEAKEMIKLALELEPNNGYVLRNVGAFFTILGRQNESIYYCLKAVQNDPVQRTALLYLERAYYYSGQYKKAYETLIKQDEWYPYLNLLNINSLYRARTLALECNDPETLKNFRSKTSSQAFLLFLDFYLAHKNQEYLKAQNILNELITLVPQRRYSLASCYALLGDSAKSLELLELAYAESKQTLMYIKVDPTFESIRHEPRFQKILRQLNFLD